MRLALHLCTNGRCSRGREPGTHHLPSLILTKRKDGNLSNSKSTHTRTRTHIRLLTRALWCCSPSWRRSEIPSTRSRQRRCSSRSSSSRSSALSVSQGQLKVILPLGSSMSSAVSVSQGQLKVTPGSVSQGQLKVTAHSESEVNSRSSARSLSQGQHEVIRHLSVPLAWVRPVSGVAFS